MAHPKPLSTGFPPWGCLSCEMHPQLYSGPGAWTPRMLTHPAGPALAVSMNRVTAIRVVTVTATGTAFPKLPLLREGVEGRAVSVAVPCPPLPQAGRPLGTYRAGQLAVGPTPPRGAGAGSSLGAAGCLVGTLAAGIATEAPGSRRTGDRAVTTLPAWKRGLAGRDGDAAPLLCGALAVPGSVL